MQEEISFEARIKNLGKISKIILFRLLAPKLKTAILCLTILLVVSTAGVIIAHISVLIRFQPLLYTRIPLYLFIMIEFDFLPAHPQPSFLTLFQETLILWKSKLRGLFFYCSLFFIYTSFILYDLIIKLVFTQKEHRVTLHATLP